MTALWQALAAWYCPLGHGARDPRRGGVPFVDLYGTGHFDDMTRRFGGAALQTQAQNSGAGESVIGSIDWLPTTLAQTRRELTLDEAIESCCRCVDVFNCVLDRVDEPPTRQPEAVEESIQAMSFALSHMANLAKQSEQSKPLERLVDFLLGDAEHSEKQSSKDASDALTAVTAPRPRRPRPLSLDSSDGALCDLTRHVCRYDFNAKKDFAQVFSFLFRPSVRRRAITYVLRQGKPLVMSLLKGARRHDSWLSCGKILRILVRREPLCKWLLSQDDFINGLCEAAQLHNFEVASDAMNTLELLLTKHEAVVAKSLHIQYELWMGFPVTEHCGQRFYALLSSDQYVTRRFALKTLGKIVTTRAHYYFMIKFVNDVRVLELLLPLCRGKHKAVRKETWALLKLVLINPRKTGMMLEQLRTHQKFFLKRFLPRLMKSEQDDRRLLAEAERAIGVLQAL
ncbi:MAG: hypothetical protein MHM6MM_008230 [Cercozoa sp. M6MM]